MDPQNITSEPILPVDGSTPLADKHLCVISTMLTDLDVSAATPQSRAKQPCENKLAQVRLGVATSLFTALQAKHPASAAHSLRVAMGCSAWGLTMDISGEQHDQIEAAALLHDIGKIGVPDYVLTKPGRLEHDEQALMQQHRLHGVRILSSCTASSDLMDIVRYAPAWYGKQCLDFDRYGDELPLGARILAIVDAFDSMTTDHVWRRAMSRERAIGELFQHAGSQFDPTLVRQFSQLQIGDLSHLQTRVARRWLNQLDPQQSNELWQLNNSFAGGDGKVNAELNSHHQILVENMHDAVVFVDDNLQITYWNHGAERLTGIMSAGIVGQRWLPRLIEMLNDHGLVIVEADCPIAHSIRNGVQLVRRHIITGRDGKEVQVNVHIIPVLSDYGTPRGATLLLQDMSGETTLEEQIQNLNVRATQDALTKVANRAEFDRSLARFIDTHLERNIPCALVLCDIDHFKSINDTYGHQAGDESLKSFAGLLKQSCRTGDVVARYGGEEFALLCADCDNGSATARAEKIRRKIAAIAHDALGGASFTSSFGVTEVQQGDNPETILRRADRALYEAKEMGRNMVVQLGSGLSGMPEEEPKSWWKSWFGGGKVDQLLEARLVANVPIKIVIEKLRGFVADQQAEISSADEDHVVLTLDGPTIPLLRRTADREVPFSIELQFEERVNDAVGSVQTLINVIIRPKRGRDRRRSDSVVRARQVIASLKSYLIAHDNIEGDCDAEETDISSTLRQKCMLNRARDLLGPWLDSASQK